MDYIQTPEDIAIFLARPSSTITVVFDPRAPISNSKRNPFSGAQNTRGWEKLATFDWNRRLSRKRCEIGQWLLWNINRKS